LTITLGDKWDIDGDQYEDEKGKLFGFEEPFVPTLEQKLVASLAESAMIRQAFEAEWDEEKHPRDDHGRWTDGGSSGSSMLDKPSSAFPPARTWTQERNKETTKETTSKVTGLTRTETVERKGLTGSTRTIHADTLNQYVRPEVGRVVGGKVQNADGSWRNISAKDLTPEVQQLFKEIIAKELEGRTPVANPTATILGGGPGSGKSYTAALFGLAPKGDEDPHAWGVKNNIVSINADELRAQLPWAREAYEKATGPVSVAQYHEMASLLSNELMAAAAAGHYNVVLDGTGDSSIKKLAERLDRFRAAGHSVNGLYVTCSVLKAEAQANKRANNPRVPSDRRLVPLEVLHEAHLGVSDVFPLATEMGLFDKWTLHDTNGTSPRLVASGHGKERKLHDTNLWDHFRNKSAHGRVFGVENEPIDADTFYSLVASILTGEPLPWASPQDIERAQRAIDSVPEGFEVDIPHEIAGHTT
jgi:hypothetical protein